MLEVILSCTELVEKGFYKIEELQELWGRLQSLLHVWAEPEKASGETHVLCCKTLTILKLICEIRVDLRLSELLSTYRILCKEKVCAFQLGHR